MKKIVYIFTCCIGMLAVVSCTDFLKEDPKSNSTKSTFYKTSADAEQSVNRLYRTGVNTRICSFGAYMGSYAGLDQMMTGYFWNDYEGQEVVCSYARQLTRQGNTATTSDRHTDALWQNAYQAINYANSDIMYIPEINMDTAKRAQLVAEAKFFRAYNYLYLVKSFGAVPLQLIPTESMDDDWFVERAPVASIYSAMESDLKDAVNTLPDKTFSANGHRITKYVAAMVLANVYMREKKYSDAAAAVKIVIDSPHSLTANDDLAEKSAFNKLRTTDNLPESIYAYEYDGSISNAGNLPPSGLWPGAESILFNAKGQNVYAIAHKTFGPTNRYLNVYKADDLRIQPNQFFHWNWTNPVNNKRIPESGDATEAGIWYYVDEDALAEGSSKADKDWNFYRYAEALLLAAEAIAESTGVVSAEAAGYLAEIKARADMNGKTVADYTTELQALSKEAFVQECWSERLREFPVEYKLWDDCTRTGMYPVISETVKGEITWVPLVGATNGMNATFKESDLYWPIPVLELQRNPNLTQNDGYTIQ